MYPLLIFNPRCIKLAVLMRDLDACRAARPFIYLYVQDEAPLESLERNQKLQKISSVDAQPV